MTGKIISPYKVIRTKIPGGTSIRTQLPIFEDKAAFLRSVSTVRKHLADHSKAGVAVWIAIGNAVKNAFAVSGVTFRDMFAERGNELKDKSKFPFCRTTGLRYVEIARVFGVLVPTGHHLLPASWRTLSEIAKLPINDIKRYTASGAIHPLTTRAEAQKLVNPTPRKAKAPVTPLRVVTEAADADAG